MADFYASFSALPQYRLHTVITQGAQSISGNSSDVVGAEYVEKLSGSGYFTGNSGNSGSISGDISVAAGGWAPYDFTSDSSRLIGTGTGAVGHNADGTRTASGSFAAADSAGGNMGSAGGSWALGLTPIPRGALDRRDSGIWKDSYLERWDPATNSWKLQVLERYTGSAWVRET